MGGLVGSLVVRLGRFSDLQGRLVNRLVDRLVDHMDEQIIVCPNCKGVWEDVQPVKSIPL